MEVGMRMTHLIRDREFAWTLQARPDAPHQTQMISRVYSFSGAPGAQKRQNQSHHGEPLSWSCVNS